ncbi:ubiquinol-cytochrome c reductase iron-sulfur subunit [Gemmatimonas groenlandica]|uniref:Rieske (2Fe-2S) protein n=1 Tax=Gemmatimonas groenlandica TaxID=2732249 RepID=A0A6M4IQL4_9BACT|nr:Rieske (2Fe-2S) protein [Gemmatimonas groenlandica]QJR37003.1 Rieske (2Fe-2S) protein [Gemmatimonas groenlandica]
MLRVAAAMLPTIGCRGVMTGTDETLPDAIPPDAVVLSSDAIYVRVDRIPALSAADSAVVLLAARIIVIRTGPATFRALSAECPHAGCGVSVVDRPRLICPCHGSEFDFTGQRLAGPAATGLVLLQSEYDGVRAELRVLRAGVPQLSPNSSRA